MPTAETASTTSAIDESHQKNVKRRIIIDTDAGADDVSAIILAAKDPNVEILGVTALVGNVDLEQATRNALMALEIAGAEAPVYKGATTTHDGRERTSASVFGTDGMGDVDLVHPKGKAKEGNAVDFILETVRANPGEVEIVTLGPATNIADAIAADPATMAQVMCIWSMGTCGLGPGNASPVAEFNAYVDPEAYKRMLDSGLPITVIGLDMCLGDAMWTDEQLASLQQACPAGEFVAASFDKIRKFYRGNGYEAVANCDALAMACVLFPDFVRSTISCHGSCITDEGETHGEVLFYQEGFTYDNVSNDFDYNVSLISDVDKDSFFARYEQAISSS